MTRVKSLIINGQRKVYVESMLTTFVEASEFLLDRTSFSKGRKEKRRPEKSEQWKPWHAIALTD